LEKGANIKTLCHISLAASLFSSPEFGEDITISRIAQTFEANTDAGIMTLDKVTQKKALRKH
jgi:hypothetical protein